LKNFGYYSLISATATGARMPLSSSSLIKGSISTLRQRFLDLSSVDILPIIRELDERGMIATLAVAEDSD